jgi:hypothetical protein
VATLAAYLAFALLGIVGPGLALQRLVRVRIDPALVLPLGYAFCAAAYGLSLVTHLAGLFPLLVLVVLATLAVDRRGWGISEGPPLRGALPAFAGLLVMLAAVEYGQNRSTPAGDFVVDPVLVQDTVFHIGLTWELAQDYPPQVPGLSGVPLGYHLGHPLVRAAACRWAGVSPADSISRFDVTLAALALLLALRAVVHALGGSARAVALVSWALVASDLSFLFAWGRHLVWWLGLLEGSHGIFSILHDNSLVPALALALASVVAFVRYQRGEGRGWLILVAALALALPFFKFFVAAQLLLGLGAAFLVARSRPALLAWIVPLAAASLAMLAGPAATGIEVVFDPLLAVREARESLGLLPLHGLPLVLWSLPWAAGGLGLRLAGLPSSWVILRRRVAASVALVVMAWSGWPLGMLLRISPHDWTAKPNNDALYFFEQSGLLLWVFAALALSRLSWKGWRRPALWLACASLTLPSTVHTLMTHARMTPLTIPAAAVRAMGVLEHDSVAGAVVLQRPLLMRFPPPPLVLIGRRVPYAGLIGYFDQFTSTAAVDARLRRVQQFFRTPDAAEAAAIAHELGATHVCLFGADEVAFDKAALLEPLFEDAVARVYRLSPSRGSAPARQGATIHALPAQHR